MFYLNKFIYFNRAITHIITLSLKQYLVPPLIDLLYVV